MRQSKYCTYIATLLVPPAAEEEEFITNKQKILFYFCFLAKVCLMQRQDNSRKMIIGVGLSQVFNVCLIG